jgi:hypothetical protein
MEFNNIYFYLWFRRALPADIHKSGQIFLLALPTRSHCEAGPGDQGVCQSFLVFERRKPGIFRIKWLEFLAQGLSLV